MTGLTTYLVEVELVIIFSESLSVQAINSDLLGRRASWEL